MKISVFTLLVLVIAAILGGCAAESTREAAATPGTAAEALPAPASSSSAESAAVGSGAPASRSPAPTSAPAAPRAQPSPAAPETPRMYDVPAGTQVSVILIDSLSTGKNKAGDEFMASLAAPLVLNGDTVLERGTKVRGRVVDAEGSGRVSGVASMRLVLTSIVDGTKTYPIVTKPFVAEAEASKGRDAGIIGGAAGVGAAIGAIAGGKKGAGTGAIIGGAAGTGTVLATKGKEVEFDSETKLNFMLDRPAELPSIKRIS